MDILDLPANPHFKNGKIFPVNVRIIGYLFLGVSLIALLGNVYVGIALLVMGAFISFTSNHVIVDTEAQTTREYTAYFGFIRIGKSMDYKKYSLITVVPTRQTTTAYARASQHTSSTEYLFALCLLTANFRGKKELTKLTQKSQAEDLAREMADRMGIAYFDYDPQVVREKMQGR